MSQTCNKCERQLPLERFSKQATAKNGYRKTCKDCHNRYVREVWYANNSEIQKKASAEWKERNVARVLATRYKCSVEEIETLLQIGKCQICGSKDNLHIDHCHETGKVRGLLCRSCNHGLGQFYDKIYNLQAAIAYLEDSVRG